MVHTVHGVLKVGSLLRGGCDMKNVPVNHVLDPGESDQPQDEHPDGHCYRQICMRDAPVQEPGRVDKEDRQGHGYVRAAECLKHGVLEELLGAFVLWLNNRIHTVKSRRGYKCTAVSYFF